MTNDAISRESNGLSEEYFSDFEEAEDGCYECGGEGWITDECFEDSCCCDDPDADHDIVPCPRCNPGGVA